MTGHVGLFACARPGRMDIVDVLASSCEHRNELTRYAATTEWCEDSAELMDVASQLATRDRDRVTAHLRPFLARIDYRRAVEMNASVVQKLVGGWRVYRSWGVLPPLPLWLKQVAANEPWYLALVRMKRVLRGAASQDTV